MKATLPASPPAEHAGPITVPEFEIIPVKALPIVGVLLALLVLVISQDWFWGLTFFHVASGGMWTGIDLFVGLVLGPIIGRLSPQARIEFVTRFMPKMVLIMPTLVTMTLAAGWQLALHTGDWAVPYPQHWWLTGSYIIVGIMSVIALGILEPANLAVLFELKKPRPDGELIGRLMRRFVYTAGITGVMQLATLIIMTRLATW
jgi:hypothetical protein